MPAKKGWLIGGARGMSIHYGAYPLCLPKTDVQKRLGVYATTISNPEEVTCVQCYTLFTAQKRI